MASEKVRRVVELRRSNAAQPIPSKRKYRRPQAQPPQHIDPKEKP